MTVTAKFMPEEKQQPMYPPMYGQMPPGQMMAPPGPGGAPGVAAPAPAAPAATAKPK